MSSSDFPSNGAEGEGPFEADPLKPEVFRRRFATARVILALMFREMSTRYGRTPGGYLWTFLEPVAMIALLSLAFALVIKTPPLGNSFLLFYASGMMPYLSERNIEGVVAKSIVFSRSLLMFPAVTWVDAILARFILNALNASFVSMIILTGILYIEGTNTIVLVPNMVISMLLVAYLGLGAGTLLCLITGLYPGFRTFWKIVTKPLLLASGVLYTFWDLPTIAQEILWWNPLVHVIGMMRSGIYPTYNTSYVSVPYVLAFATISLAVGLLFLRAYYQDIISDE